MMEGIEKSEGTYVSSYISWIYLLAHETFQHLLQTLERYIPSILRNIQSLKGHMP